MPHASVPDDFALRDEHRPVLSRRACIARAIAGIVGAPLLGGFAFSSETSAVADDAAEIAEVTALGKKAGLAPFADNLTDHFLGLGDADAAYSKNALAYCEKLVPEFLDHFRERGFKLDLPPNRMTVITLKDEASYCALLNEKKGTSVGGHYDLDTNRLVVFDYRDTKEEIPDNPERINLFTLIHETLHLLSFNTGVFSRELDVPACISEGLATYGEFWRPKVKGKSGTRLGTTNGKRLQIFDARAGDGRWIPIPDLFAKDGFFEDEDTVHLAYGEAWALVHYLLKPNAKPLARFHAYLAKLPTLQDAGKRIKIAEAELGPLKALDKAVKSHVKEQLRRAK
jgi:hypothetical protein